MNYKIEYTHIEAVRQANEHTHTKIHIHTFRDKCCQWHDIYRQTNLRTPNLQHDE